MNYLDVIQFEAYVAACANNGKIRVIWDKPEATPRTDNRTMWLPRITSKSSSDWLTRIRYYVKHETSHIAMSDFGFLNKMKPQGLLMLINNLLEDHRIDYLNDAEYAGDRLISDAFWKLYTQDVVDRMTGEGKISEQQQLVLPLFVWESSMRNWIGSSTETSITMEKLLDDIGRERLDKLYNYSSALLVMRESGGAQEVWDLSVKILQEVFDINPEDIKPEEKSDVASDDSTSDSSDDELVVNADIKELLEAIGHKHELTRDGEYVHTERPLSGTYTIPLPTDYKILRFPELHACVGHSESSTLDKYNVQNYITSNAKPLANKLRIKLQTRSRDRYEYGLKKGKLHNGSLHRLLLGDAPNADKVFRQRKVTDTLDTAVCLLVDCSGSMQGRKFNMACCAAGAFSGALKPLNIAHTVLGFTNTRVQDDPMVWVFSDFNERISEDQLISRFDRASGCLWENTDGDALAYAQYVLSLRKEKRKVLLVISDGDPAGRDEAGDIRAYTKQMVQDIEKSKIDVYGIGLLHDGVKNYYKNHIIVRDVSELTPAIVNILDRSI